MSISKAEKQDHLVAVAMLAEENGGTVTPQLICQKLLPDRPIAVGEKAIERCEELGILTHQGEITEEGRRAIRRQTVFMPERGRYAVYYTEDPLVEQSVLDVTAVQEPKLIDTFNSVANAEGDKKKHAAVSALPRSFRSLEGKEAELLGKKKELIKFLDFEDKTTKVSDPVVRKVSATLTISDDRAEFLRLTGDINATIDPPDMDFLGTLKEILKGRGLKWGDPVKERLCCSFNELTDMERVKFMRDIDLKSVTIGNLGEFAIVRLTDIPIAPAKKTDADKWAMALLMNRINTYLSPDTFEGYCREVESIFNRLDYEVELPSQGNLATIVKNLKREDEKIPSPKYWFLQAPIDLGGASVPHAGGRRGGAH